MGKGRSGWILKCAAGLEYGIAVFILAVTAGAAALLLIRTAQALFLEPGAFSVSGFLSDVLLIVMGVEFVRMLVLHTPGAVIDVLLFAIARQMTVSHAGSLETLLGVAAVAGIFAVKKFLHTEGPDL